MRRLVVGLATLALVIAGLLVFAAPSDACQPKEYTPVEQTSLSPVESRQAERSEASGAPAVQAGQPAPSQGDAPGVPTASQLSDPAGNGERRSREAVDAQAGTLRGVASTYGPGFGGNTAVPVRGWLGSRVQISYRAACVIRTVTDYGPDQRVWPGRVVDLDQATFEALCDCGWRRGLLYDVTVELISERD